MYGEARCACCDRTFQRSEPEEEAWIEAVMQFGGIILEQDSDEVCEECYQKVIADVLGRATWKLYKSIDETSAEYQINYEDRVFWVRVQVTEGGFSGVLIYHPEEDIVPGLTMDEFKRNATLTVARLAA